MAKIVISDLIDSQTTALAIIDAKETSMVKGGKFTDWYYRTFLKYGDAYDTITTNIYNWMYPRQP